MPKKDDLLTRWVKIRNRRRKRASALRKSLTALNVSIEKLNRTIAKRKASKRPLRLRALDEAKDLVGVMETGGNNRGAEVERIIRENGGMVGEPWCGDFVAHCYRTAGSKSVQRGWASTLQLGYLAGMGKITRPLPGDIVVYDFPGGQSSDHTGLFCRFEAGGLVAIEGNTGATGAVSDSTTGGDGVYIKRRSTTLVARYVRVYR